MPRKQRFKPSRKPKTAPSPDDNPMIPPPQDTQSDNESGPQSTQ